MLQSQPTPKVFISYSHDSTAHKAWVLTLATRLEGNGVAVTLDQWDLKIGGDLPHFMESGLSDSDRVIVVCTDEYVRKANAMQSGGVGYEKMIITSQIMRDLGSNRVIPIVINNEQSNVPTFVATRLWLDFSSENYEQSYRQLIADLWGESVQPRPPRGENPFNRQPVAVEPIVFDIPESFVSPALTNTVTFNPTLNNGKFWVGAGDMAFELSWSRCSKGSIWIYNRQESIHSLRIPTGITEIEQINNAECNYHACHCRTPGVCRVAQDFLRPVLVQSRCNPAFHFWCSSNEQSYFARAHTPLFSVHMSRECRGHRYDTVQFRYSQHHE